MRIEFHPDAEVEFIQATDQFAERETRLAQRFVAEVKAVATLVKGQPEIGRLLDPIHRRFSLRRFPFFIVYRVDGDTIRIIAVAHKRRLPGYWRMREGH